MRGRGGFVIISPKPQCYGRFMENYLELQTCQACQNQLQVQKELILILARVDPDMCNLGQSLYKSIPEALASGRLGPRELGTWRVECLKYPSANYLPRPSRAGSSIKATLRWTERVFFFILSLDVAVLLPFLTSTSILSTKGIPQFIYHLLQIWSRLQVIMQNYPELQKETSTDNY